MSRKFDVILWGATGFTGKLAAEYLSGHYNRAGGQALKWAIAGRNHSKLDNLRKTLTNPDNVQIVVASIDDPDSMKSMTSQTTVIVATAGPFDIIGMPVVDACVSTGTSYVDITGEATFVRKVIDKYHDVATQKKIQIVPCCGFDCVPVDMGCFVVVNEMKRRNLVPTGVQTTLLITKGGASGGTMNSVLNLFESCSLLELLALLNPYYLVPRDKNGSLDEPCASVKRAAGDRNLPYYDKLLKKWCAPFVMQAIDTRVVNRSNSIKNWQYGKHFVYTESIAVPNAIIAILASLAFPLVGVLLYFRITRYFVSLFLPKSGEGPTREQRENGFFKFHVNGSGYSAETGESKTVCAMIDAPNGDGGYKQTARMVCEAGICIALRESTHDDEMYGVLTPSTALGSPFLQRLKESPGITFPLED